MSAECGKEQSFTAEEHRLEVAGTLNVVVNAFGECDQTTGIDPQGLSFEFFLDDGSAGVNKGFTVAVEPLQNKAFAAEETGSQLSLERDRDLRPQRRAEKRVLDEAAAPREWGAVLSGARPVC